MNLKENIETPEQYIQQLDNDRKQVINKLRGIILDNIPDGFMETTANQTISYVVPHSIYPEGYHCDPASPLPFISIASQKNHIAIYHMGIYADENLKEWFVSEYPKHSKTKLDMGKSCIKFKKPENIPYQLIGELVSKVGVSDWIKIYESVIKK